MDMKRGWPSLVFFMFQPVALDPVNVGASVIHSPGIRRWFSPSE
jgi:hypothetical protein